MNGAKVGDFADGPKANAAEDQQRLGGAPKGILSEKPVRTIPDPAEPIPNAKDFGQRPRASVGRRRSFSEISSLTWDFPTKKSVSDPLLLRMSRLFSTILPFVLLLAAERITFADGTGGLDARVQGFIDANCMTCHDAESEKGDFRIDKLSSKVGLEDTPQWLEVMERISSGEMPPKAPAWLHGSPRE
jgi:hypothetical protein